jgi:ribosome-binding factor A
MPQGHRPDRLGDQIRTEVSDILAREVHDPGVGFVTITRVSLTADLQIARVYYTTMAAGPARKDTARALQRATPFVRRQLAGRLGLRRMPELEFRFDQSIEQHARIEELIHEIHEQDAAREAEHPDAGETDGSTGETDGSTGETDGSIGETAADKTREP